jgi:exonuclease III
MDLITSFKRHEASYDRAETSKDKFATRVGKSDVSLSITDKANEQRIGKNVEELNNIIHQLDLADRTRTLQPTSAKYTLFPSTHGTCSKIDHMLGQETNRSKYKRTKIMHGMPSDFNGINYPRKMKTHVHKQPSTKIPIVTL